MAAFLNIGVDLGRVGDQLKAFREQCNGANDEGVKAMASLFRNAVRHEFAIKGAGRTYPSRRGRVARALTVEQTALSAVISSGLDAKGNKPSRRQFAQLRARLGGVNRRLKKATGHKVLARGAPLHQASVVGASPASDVGTLPLGIQAGVTDGERRVGDVGRWAGWQALHDGGGRLHGPRPFLLNALAKVRGKLSGVYTEVVRKHLAAHE